jgi:hypothetical protein
MVRGERRAHVASAASEALLLRRPRSRTALARTHAVWVSGLMLCAMHLGSGRSVRMRSVVCCQTPTCTLGPRVQVTSLLLRRGRGCGATCAAETRCAWGWESSAARGATSQARGHSCIWARFRAGGAHRFLAAGSKEACAQPARTTNQPPPASPPLMYRGRVAVRYMVTRVSECALGPAVLWTRFGRRAQLVRSGSTLANWPSACTPDALTRTHLAPHAPRRRVHRKAQG